MTILMPKPTLHVKTHAACPCSVPMLVEMNINMKLGPTIKLIEK
jgi:hypothetical protein